MRAETRSGIRRFARLAIALVSLAVVFPEGRAQQAPAAGAAMLSADAEARLRAVVRDAVASGQGGARILAGRRVASLTYREVMGRALRQNLALQLQRQLSVEAGAVALRAQSAFDSVATVATSYSQSTSSERSEVITRLRRPQPDFEEFERRFLEELQNGTPGSAGQPATCKVTVDGQPVLDGASSGLPECQPRVTSEQEFASFRGLKPTESLALTVSAAKLAAYGGQFTLSLASIYNPRQSPYVRVNSTDVAYIDPRWAYASTLSLGFVTPLPFGKNYGPYGTAQATELRLAQTRLARSSFEYESAANGTLLAVDNAYSDLVGSLMLVQVALEQKQVLEQLRARARRYFELGEINQYAMDQVDARLATTLAREALAWNSLASASEALANLLNADILELLLPAAYRDYLESAPRLEFAAALAGALERNADIRRGELLLEESRVVLSHRQADARPDLLVRAEASLGQNSQIVGHPDLGTSLRNAFNPDVRTLSFGLLFRLPLGNVAAKAAVSQARVGVAQAEDQLTLVRAQVVQQLSAAVDALQSANKQIEVSRINMQLAEDAFDGATRRRALNLLTEFEHLEVQNDLLDARLRYIDALVQYRKNVARFLASQNLLAEAVSE